MNNRRDELIKTIWHGQDPFAGFPTTIYQVDKQGWNNTHHYLTEAIDTPVSSAFQLAKSL